MRRDEELQGLDGNVKIDEYRETNGYSVYESTQEFLKAWNAENALAAVQGEPLACEFFKAGFTKAGNLWVCFKEPSGKLGVLTITPAWAKANFPDRFPTEPSYKVSPKGLKLYAGEEWTLSATDVNTKLQGLTLAIVYEFTVNKDNEPVSRPTLVDIF